MPAATFGANPSKIRMGISRKPGPIPNIPARIEIGIARIKAVQKFSFAYSAPITGRKSEYARKITTIKYTARI